MESKMSIANTRAIVIVSVGVGCVVMDDRVRPLTSVSKTERAFEPIAKQAGESMHNPARVLEE